MTQLKREKKVFYFLFSFFFQKFKHTVHIPYNNICSEKNKIVKSTKQLITIIIFLSRSFIGRVHFKCKNTSYRDTVVLKIMIPDIKNNFDTGVISLPF